MEVFRPSVTIVDDEFYFTPDPIATPLVLSVVVDVVMYKTIYVINIIIYMCSQHSNVL